MAVLKTERLQLRPLASEDLATMHALWMMRYLRRYLFDDRIVPIDEVRQRFEESARNFRERGYGLWCIGDGGAGEVLGFVGLLSGDPDPSLVYGVREEQTRRGLATEAARAVLDHAFDRLRLPRILADVDEPNTASVRVLDRLGARKLRREVVEGRPLLYFELVPPANVRDA